MEGDKEGGMEERGQVRLTSQPPGGRRQGEGQGEREGGREGGKEGGRVYLAMTAWTWRRVCVRLNLCVNFFPEARMI